MSEPTRQDLYYGCWHSYCDDHRLLTDAEFDRIARAEGYVKPTDVHWKPTSRPCDTCNETGWELNTDGIEIGFCPSCGGTGTRTEDT